MIFFDKFFSKKNWSEEFVAFADCCVFFTQKLWQMAGAAFICCISHGRDDDTNGTSIRIDGLMQLSAIVTVVPDVSSLSKAQVLKMAVAMEGIAALCFIERTPPFFFSLRCTFRESKEIQKFSQKATKFTKSKIKFQSFIIIQCLIRNFQFPALFLSFSGLNTLRRPDFPCADTPGVAPSPLSLTLKIIQCRVPF